MKTDIFLRKHQIEVYKKLNRFNVLLAHRRFGKTVFAVIMAILKNLECDKRRPQTHYYAPSYAQAKKVAWAYLKEYCEPLNAEFNESELKATLPTGGIVQLGSADNPHASRGIYSDFAVLDEPAQMPPSMWTEVLRPALSDRHGGALMIGTPHGRHGLFYDSYQDAEEHDDWWRGMYKASETGIVAQDELDSALRSMTQAEYDQEFECSWDAAVRGAYYAKDMNLADADGRITRLAYDDSRLVHCVFDLGFNDETAIWWFQMDGYVTNLIKYDEVTNMGLPDIVKEIKKLPYQYGPMIFPHDVEVHGLNTGRTRRETLEQLGIDVIVAPKSVNLQGDIDVTRSFIKKCNFDSLACKDGIEALRQYRSDWSEKNSVLSLRPVHNWASHGADSFRYLATTDLSQLDQSSWGSDIEYADDGRH